jgi:hypothetical protein
MVCDKHDNLRGDTMIGKAAAIAALTVAALPAVGGGVAQANFCEGAGGFVGASVKSDHIVWHANNWPVDDGTGDQAYTTWALYVDVQYGNGAIHRKNLKVLGTTTDEGGCLTYSVKATTRWSGQKVARVDAFVTTGEWGAQTYFGNLHR